jgi:hypothetical protein
MLPHWMVWYVSLSALECFPAIDHINVRLANFLLECLSVQSPSESSVDLDSRLQRFFIYN